MASPTLSCCPPLFNLADHVLSAGCADPQKTALDIVAPDGADGWSYAQLTEAVARAAGVFLSHADPGARVLIRLGNQVEFPVAFLGAVHAGLIPLPASAALTGVEVTRLARVFDPDLIVAAPGLALPGGRAPVLRADLFRAPAADPMPPALGSPDRPGYMIATSGTGSEPRLVLHAHRAIWARQSMVEGWTGLTRDDRVLHAGALNWTYTLGVGLLDPWTRGATALIPAAGTPVEALPRLLARHRATIFAGVPGLFRRLSRDWPLASRHDLRHALSAGEKLPEPVRDAWRAATGTDIHEAYGQSECSTFISGSATRPAPPGSLGYPQPGRRIAVLDDRGAAVPEGRLAVHRDDPGLCLGLPGAEAEWTARQVGEWVITGDLVRRRDDGALDYLGREDDVLTAGGYRIAPAEIEDAITSYPGVSEAAAVQIEARPDTFLICGFYVSENPLDEVDLSRHIFLQLARYKHPRILKRVAALPKGMNGKVLRRELRAANVTFDN
jgi:acyl-coenzyme A synthetase/AMP-(fatty) acid ligase